MGVQDGVEKKKGKEKGKEDEKDVRRQDWSPAAARDDFTEEKLIQGGSTKKKNE